MPRLAALAIVLAACDRGSRSVAMPARAPIASSDAQPASIGTPCDDTGLGSPGVPCTQYDSAREAFREAIEGDPLVLAVGEAHAPKGASVPSAAKRFTEDLLPLLAGRASDLLVELMMPPDGCRDAAAEARRTQEPVTSRHAESAQDEYVAMGERARSLGIVPDMLRPSCADVAAIAAAGDDMIDVSLTTIARLSRAQAIRLVDRDARSDVDRGKMVVLYGGALHNDLNPRPGTDAARWSYAPELDAHVRGRFVAIDLVVPETIGNDESWRSLPWWSAYEARRGDGGAAGKAIVFRTGSRASWLVFPAAAPP